MEYPSAHDFYCHSNTHDPNQDGFHDLYQRDFIHALSQVAQHKLSCHQLDPYQCAAFQHSIVCHNVGEEEANLTLEIAMEYAGVLGTIIFDESCHLCDLTEAQVRRNQFSMDVVVDWLDERINEIDSRADHMSERLLALEGKVTNMEAGYTELLALGWEQVEMSARSCWALANLAAIAVAQQQKICEAEERMDAMREMILALEHMWENPIMLDNEESEGKTTVSNGVELKVEENKVAIPIPPPGHLVPIEDAVQELPDKLVGTQITFNLANEDCPPSYK